MQPTLFNVTPHKEGSPDYFIWYIKALSSFTGKYGRMDNKPEDVKIFISILPAKYIAVALATWQVGESMYQLLLHPDISAEQMTSIFLAANIANEVMECNEYVRQMDSTKVQILRNAIAAL